MGESEQFKPLAPASVDRISSDEEGARIKSAKTHRGRRRCYICCGACTAILVILGIVILILALTVFKVKEPDMILNSIKIDKMNINRGTGLTSPVSINMTLTADISVKNSNAASFKFGNATTLISYRGETIGEVKSPSGKARARRTLRMNVTADVMVDQLVADQNLMGDLASGALTIGTHTVLGGRVNVLNIIKRHVDVTMRCNVTVSISSQSIEDQHCARSVKL